MVWPAIADADTGDDRDMSHVTSGAPDMSGIWQKAMNSAAKGGVAGLTAGVLQVRKR